MPDVNGGGNQAAADASARALVKEKSAPSLTATLRRRVLDLVVIAWVAAVGLTTGRQLVDWWREDLAAVPQPVRDAGEDWSRRPVDIQVGPRGLPLHRSPYVGSHAAVEQKLMQLVQSRLKDAAPLTGPMDDAERAFLERLKSELPIVPDHGEGTLYQWPAPFPGVVGTRPIDQQERIIAHGFAVPAGKDQWTLFVMTAAAKKSDVPDPLPPGAKPLLSWTDESGRRISTYRGPGVLSEWVAYWEVRYRDATCSVRDIQAHSATLQFRQGEFVIDVHFQDSENGQLTGVVWTIPLSLPDTLQSLPTDPLQSPVVPQQDGRLTK